jgi:hypothetical protein
MHGREPTTIPFSTEAMRANLLRLEGEWETVQACRSRDAIYGYLSAVFELVVWWEEERKAVTRAGRALHLRGYHSDREPKPFAAVILCTADHDKVDDRTRSKWSRVLRYAAEFKNLDEALGDFIKLRGGINECATRFARRLGRGSKKSISCCSDFIGRLALLAMERKGTAGAFERMILVATIGNW